MVWKAVAGYNNYSLAALLVVGSLFQQSGFSLPLDRDQVRLHNTPLCSHSEREGERKRKLQTCQAICTHMFQYVQACMLEYVLVVGKWHMRVCACVCFMTAVLNHTLFSHACWIARPPSYLPNLHRYIITASAFLLPQHNQQFWDPWQHFPSPRRHSNGVCRNSQELSKVVTDITVSVKQYSEKQMQL